MIDKRLHLHEQKWNSICTTEAVSDYTAKYYIGLLFDKAGKKHTQ